ncbi:MAG: hypothetical protein ACK50J_23865 [Planctomyces sp.]
MMDDFDLPGLGVSEGYGNQWRRYRCSVCSAVFFDEPSGDFQSGQL